MMTSEIGSRGEVSGPNDGGAKPPRGVSLGADITPSGIVPDNVKGRFGFAASTLSDGRAEARSADTPSATHPPREAATFRRDSSGDRETLPTTKEVVVSSEGTTIGGRDNGSDKTFPEVNLFASGAGGDRGQEVEAPAAATGGGGDVPPKKPPTAEGAGFAEPEDNGENKRAEGIPDTTVKPAESQPESATVFDVAANDSTADTTESAGKTDRPSYRRQGDYEQSDPSIEPLPPTPVTSNAEERLKSWGMNGDQIRKLRELTSSFRYDLSLQRGQEIADRGGYIFIEDDGTETVILPDFRRPSLNGECGNNALQLMNLAGTAGYMEEVNQALERDKKLPLELSVTMGASETHFIAPDSNHTWVYLRPEGTFGEGVNIDPSFQTIKTSEEDGAHWSRRIFGHDDITINPAEELSLGTHHFDPTTGRFTTEGSVTFKTLGASQDRELVYNVGFTKDSKTSKILPNIFALFPDGESIRCVGVEGEFVHSEVPAGKQAVFDAHRRELETLMETFGGMSLERDQAKAEEERNRIVIIDFKNKGK